MGVRGTRLHVRGVWPCCDPGAGTWRRHEERRTQLLHDSERRPQHVSRQRRRVQQGGRVLSQVLSLSLSLSRCRSASRRVGSIPATRRRRRRSAHALAFSSPRFRTSAAACLRKGRRGAGHRRQETQGHVATATSAAPRAPSLLPVCWQGPWIDWRRPLLCCCVAVSYYCDDVFFRRRRAGVLMDCHV